MNQKFQMDPCLNITKIFGFCDKSLRLAIFLKILRHLSLRLNSRAHILRHLILRFHPKFANIYVANICVAFFYTRINLWP